jgi:arabinose-5-phosphate isomerase
MIGKNEEEVDCLALGREVLDIEIEGLAAVRDRLDESFERATTMLAECRGRVVVTGLGKSGLVGRKIAATLSSTGTPAQFLHPVEGAHGDLGMIREGDVALAISNSGETDELNVLVPCLRSLGARIIALTGNPCSTLARTADAVINVSVPREACPMNLAPTTSTTATLAAGDALAVCLMHWRSFDEEDFLRYHPGGSLGQRLKTPVAGLMHTGVPKVGEDTPLSQALEELNSGGLGAVVVTGAGGRLAGILTDGDVRRLVCAGELDPKATVSSSMIRAPRAARPDQSVAELLDIMEEKTITVLPIVDQDNVVIGVVHLHDLLGKGRLRFSG